MTRPICEATAIHEQVCIFLQKTHENCYANASGPVCRNPHCQIYTVTVIVPGCCDPYLFLDTVIQERVFSFKIRAKIATHILLDVTAVEIFTALFLKENICSRMIDAGLVGSTSLGGVPQEQKMLKEQLP